jgi:hypothetical protein
VVLFAFQLWWMLALRFCWPRDADAVKAVTNFLDANDLAAIMGNATLRDQLDELLEVPGGAKLLADTGLFTKKTGLAKAVPTTLDPAEAVLSVVPTPEPTPDDPLCPRPS